MWHHAATKENLKKIESFGNKIIPVEKGELASGLYGDGRMAEPETIVQFLEDNFFFEKDPYRQKGICFCRSDIRTY
jgi:phosphopantothenoylcysteine decarboxylase/phosphopantothenate--cysteine ligase